MKTSIIYNGDTYSNRFPHGFQSFLNVDKSSMFPLLVRTVGIEQNVGGVKFDPLPIMYMEGKTLW